MKNQYNEQPLDWKIAAILFRHIILGLAFSIVGVGLASWWLDGGVPWPGLMVALVVTAYGYVLLPLTLTRKHSIIYYIICLVLSFLAACADIHWLSGAY